MKRNLWIISILVIAFAACGGEKRKVETSLAIAKEAMKASMPGMVKAVSSKLAEGGPAKTIEYCSSFAGPYLEEKEKSLKTDFSKKYGISDLQLYRTSLKLRNPNNEASELEKKVLLGWKKASASGEKAKPSTFKDGNDYIVMLPILIQQEACLQCHGNEKTVSRETVEILQKMYPEDAARGYHLGDVRGAFVSRITFP